MAGSYNNYLKKKNKKKKKKKEEEAAAAFQGLPGRPDGFHELIARYSYHRGEIEITHDPNVLIVGQAAKYMETSGGAFDSHGVMTITTRSSTSLIDDTEKLLQGIDSWTWPDLLAALRQGHERLLLLSSYYDNTDPLSIVLEGYVDELVARLVSSHAAASAPSSSSCTSSFRSSCDSRSTTDQLISSNKSYCSSSSCFRSSRYWWFEDLASMLDIEVIDMVVRAMLSTHKFDHVTLSKFLLYYQKLRFRAFCASRGGDQEGRHKTSSTIERVVDLLLLLDRRSVPLRGLFGIMRVFTAASSNPHSKLVISRATKKRLESLIGAQLDEATLDDLLIPSPKGKNYVYDVNLVLRLIKSFLAQVMSSFCRNIYSTRLRKVARLTDLYAAEVAPDIGLKPSKFTALLSALPDYARECHDRIYYAMDIYLEAHGRICDEKKMRICSGLAINKLSMVVLNQVSRNANFPTVVTMKALVYRNYKASSNIYGFKGAKLFRGLRLTKEDDGGKETVLAIRARNKATTSRRLQQQKIGRRVLDLERLTLHGNGPSSSKPCCPENVKYLPKLCSG